MTTGKRRLQERVERANPVSPVHFWQSPAGAGANIFLVTHLDVYSCVHEHAMNSLPNETGGFLMGRVGYDARRESWHLEVDEAIPVDPVSQDPVHFAFTWRDVDRVRSYRESEGKALLGWYHTHPDLGIFLSETDLEKTHRVLFAEPFQIALVYDPVRHRAGYFCWEGLQTIDAGRAVWREFEIEVQAEAPSPLAPEDAPLQVEAAPATEPAAAPDAAPSPDGQSHDGDSGRRWSERPV